MRMCLVVNTVFAGKAIKGKIVFYSVRDAYLKGYLKKVVVTDYEDSLVNPKIIRKAVPFGNLVNSISFRVNKYSPVGIPTRFMTDKIFDIFSSRWISDLDMIYFQGPMWLQCMKKSKKNNAIITFRDSTANFLYALRLAHSENIFEPNFHRRTVVYNKGVNRSDCIFACSEYSKMTHIECGVPEEKIMIAGQGVDIKRFHPPKTSYDGEFRGLFVGGSVVPLKGIRYLLQAWHNFAKKKQELVLCGDIDQNVQSQIQYYKNRINLKTTGFINPESFYRQASILVYPSLTEGFEKVTMEAMASGLPIITTTNTGAAGIIKDGKEGFIVPIKNTNAIEKHIQYFYDNPSEIKRMGKNARKLTERYTWDHFSKHMCRLFETAYEGGRSR